jgi:hypothetical protein
MKKAALRRLFLEGKETYFFSPVPEVAVPAPAPASTGAAVVPAAGAEAGAETAAAGADASAAGAGAGAGVTTTGAGAGASSFLPQAARATAATMAAKTRDLFIWMILEMNEKTISGNRQKKTQIETIRVLVDRAKGLELFLPSL